MRLCVGFAELAARNGVDVRFDSPVIDIESHDGRVAAVITPLARSRPRSWSTPPGCSPT